MESFGKHTGNRLGVAAESVEARSGGGVDIQMPSGRRPLTILAVLTATVVTLRGYLPGTDGHAALPPAEPHAANVAQLVVVAVLLAISLSVLAVAVIWQLRHRRAAAAGAADRDTWRRGGGRPTWRAVLLVLALLIGYLMLVAVLARVFASLGRAAPEPGTGSGPAGTGPAGTATPWTDPPTAGLDSMPYLLAATVVFVLMAVIGSIAARRRARVGAAARIAGGANPSLPAAGGSDPLTRAAEVGLAEIGDLRREPRDAIIACYAAMERELARVPEAAPQQFDTASEVLARAVEHHALPAGSATRLVELFGEARFSRHVMREEHRDTAVRALQVVLGQLRSSA